MRTWGLTRADDELVRIRAVQHPSVNFVTKLGRFLGEADVVPDEVVALDVPRFNGTPSATLYFQASGTGRLRFYGVIMNKQWHVAARGVPSRRITDFHDLPAERLRAIRERKAQQHG